MFGSDTLEVAIGLIFLFFILSLIATAAREVLEGWMQTRAAQLERGLRELLRDEDGQGPTSQVYGHPLINSLFRGNYDPSRLKPVSGLRRLIRGLFGLTTDRWTRYPNQSNLPSYIPARNFALALLDLSARGSVTDQAGATTPATLDQIRAGINTNISNPALRRVILLALDDAKDDLDRARTNLEAWFDSGMDRVSGWYRKHTQWILFWLGLSIAFVLNVDAIGVARDLYRNDAARTAILAEAEATVQRAEGNEARDHAALLRFMGCDPPADPAQPPAAAQGATTPSTNPPAGGSQAAASPGDDRWKSCAQRRLEELPYPVGWGDRRVIWPWDFGWNIGQWWEASHFPWRSIPGWILTALAITLGAPFWFDILNKIMVIRSTVKPHEKSPEESSEDRQQ